MKYHASALPKGRRQTWQRNSGLYRETLMLDTTTITTQSLETENVFVGELDVANRVCERKVKNAWNGTQYINTVSKCE